MTEHVAISGGEITCICGNSPSGDGGGLMSIEEELDGITGKQFLALGSNQPPRPGNGRCSSALPVDESSTSRRRRH